MGRADVVLGVTVEHGGRRQDVVAEIPYGVSVAALSRAIGAQLEGAPAFVLLRVARTGEQLSPDAIAGDCDLRSGDTLILDRAPPRLETGIVAIRPARNGSTSDDEVSITLRRGARRIDGAPAVATLVAGDDRVPVPAGRHTVGSGGWSDIDIGEDLPALAFELEADTDAVVVLPVAGNAVSVDGTVVSEHGATVTDVAAIRVGAVQLQLVGTVAESRPTRPRMVIHEQETTRTRVDLGGAGSVEVNRPPRRSDAWRPEVIELPATPGAPRRIRVPFVAALVPLVAGLALFLLFKSVLFLAFMAMAPLMVGGTYFSDRRYGRKEHLEEVARFEHRLATINQHAAHVLAEEAQQRHGGAPDAFALARRAVTGDDRLWERRPWDGDFLTLRLGLGTLPAQTEMRIPRQHDSEPDPRVSGMAEHYRRLEHVPYTLPLTELTCVGFAGDRPTSINLVRALVIQAATLHSPSELGIVAAMPPGSEAGWEWLKWLPHVRTGGAVLQGRGLGTGRRGVELLQRLRDVQVRRIDEQEQRVGRRVVADGPALLLVIDEELQLERSLVTEILGYAREMRIAVLWIGRDPRGLPGQCRVTVDVTAAHRATVVEMDTGTQRDHVAVEGMDAATAHQVARALAPLRDATTTSEEATIPHRSRLLDQLEMPMPSPQQVAQRWQKPSRGLGAVIGQGAGEPFRFDLRMDGPHALIAGMTGAGKSELLRTIVAGLAAEHPPSRLTFLLIDYKGGAALAPCHALPHVLDVVDDLDAEMGERALVSLDAEMTYRERLLKSEEADSLLHLERLHPEVAPPNLVIIVDEFAKLREEVPEFIDGIVDVAQRGRSLGVHMVLAAQSLRNAFTPAVRANTPLRIALRVASETESQDVIDASDAARIASGDLAKGRAFARIGHDQLVEFQTAHVMGRYRDPQQAQPAVRPFGFDGVLGAAARRTQLEGTEVKMDETDLAHLAAAARGASELLGLAAPRRAWMPPLPAVLPRSAVQRHTDAASGHCALGMIDQPGEQRQVPLTVAFDRGNLAIFGTGGSGRSNALHTIAASLAWSAEPDRLALYAIEAEGSALSCIESLPHVGAVLPGSDTERIERLLSRLEAAVRQRSATFAAVGASSLGEYAARCELGEVPTRIVLLVDGWGEFTSVHDTARAGAAYDRVVSLLATGRPVGVHVVLTVGQRSGLRSNAAAHIAHRIVLRLASSDDLVGFGIPPRMADNVELCAGRGFTTKAELAQIALAEPAAGADVAEGFRLLGEHLAAVWPGQATPGVDPLPESVPMRRVAVRRTTASQVPVAVGGPDLGIHSIDVSERHFLVSGGYCSGRSSALQVIADQLTRVDGVFETYLLAPRRSALSDLGHWTSSARGLDACAVLTQTLAARAEELPETRSARVAVVIDDAGELQDAPTAAALVRLVKLGRDRGVRLVIASEASASRALGNPWMTEIRRDRQGMLLMPDPTADGMILGAQLPLRSSVVMCPGRGYLVRSGASTLVQFADPALPL